MSEEEAEARDELLDAEAEAEKTLEEAERLAKEAPPIPEEPDSGS